MRPAKFRGPGQFGAGQALDRCQLLDENLVPGQPDAADSGNSAQVSQRRIRLRLLRISEVTSENRFASAAILLGKEPAPTRVARAVSRPVAMVEPERTRDRGGFEDGEAVQGPLGAVLLHANDGVAYSCQPEEGILPAAQQKQYDEARACESVEQGEHIGADDFPKAAAD